MADETKPENDTEKLAVYYVYGSAGKAKDKKAGTLKFTSAKSDKDETVSYLAVEDLQTWIMKNPPDKGYEADLSSIQFDLDGKAVKLSDTTKTIKIDDDTDSIYIAADEADTDKYPVYFYSQPGQLYETDKNQTKVTYPDKDPARKGYTFDGWNVKEGTKLDGPAYVYAKWDEDVETCTVTYKYVDDDGKEQTKEYSVTEGEATPAFEAPEREGYVFKGWEPEVDDTVTGDAVYTAEYEAEPEPETYTITYKYLDKDGKEQTKEYSVTEGEATPAFEAPEREGYVFKGWKPEVDDTVTGDAVYTAQYEAEPEPETYTITYKYLDKDGKEQTKEYSVTEGEATPAFEAPEREGYVFKGWKPEVDDIVTGDAVYTAEYEAEPEPETYTITYKYLDKDGKEQTKEYSVTEGEATPAFEAPEREGYVFKGWEPAVADTVTGDAVYTAVWEKVPAAQVVDIKIVYLEEGTKKELHYPNVLKVKKGEKYDASAWDKMKIEGYTYVKTEGTVKGTAEKPETITVWYRSNKTPAKGTEGSKTSTNTNTGLYVGLGAAAAVIIVILAILSRKKK